jgi:hypothetical protein
MMTENPLTDAPGPTKDEGVPGERVRRLQRRRRLMREEFMAVAVLLVFLAAAVAVLATQWLESGPSASAAGPAPAHAQLSKHGGTT